MTKEAVVGNRPSESIVVRPVIAGVHRPIATFFRVPSQRQFNQRIRACPMQIGPRVITGTHHIINLFLSRVDRLAARIQLIPALKILPLAFNHREVRVRRLVIKSRTFSAEILHHVLL